jgi:hypothetical protein
MGAKISKTSQPYIAEDRIQEIIVARISEHEAAMAHAIARAIYLNNVEITKQLTEMGIIK